MPSRKTSSGFTLIELMIVVAVIAIISAIAYPSYAESVLKGKRGQGRAALAELLQQQERYMTQNNCYLGFTTDASGSPTPSAPSPAGACGGVTAATAPFKAVSNDTVANSAYLLSAETCGANLSIADCVKVVARPVQADAEVGNLSMTSTGVKDCSGTLKLTDFKRCWP